MDARTEMNVELKRARYWLLAVGVLIFVVDSLLTQVVQRDQVPQLWRHRYLMIDSGILVYFVVLFFVAKYRPKLACILGLVGYWGLQIGFAAYIGDVTLLFTQGILIKILFTAAMIRGLKSADRAELLKSELEKVFE